jgi:4-amino-4-deoxy-L-arabinose transferase-like glycosyltransferase
MPPRWSTRAQGGPLPENQRPSWVTALLLGGLAIVLYAPMIGWGVPYATTPDRTKTFATDEILPLEALAEMHNTFVISKADRNYGYPWWHYFVVAAAQAPYLGYLIWTGGLHGASPEFPFGLRDPVAALRALTLIGRSVSVVMGAGVVIAAYLFSSILWGHATAMVAALLTMLNYLMVYYSRTGNLDVPACFWTALGLVLFARILVAGLTPRRAAWFGGFAGLAMATKDQALVVFLPLGAALLLPRFNRPAGSNYAIRPLLIGLGTSVLAYVVATGMVVDPQRHLTHVYALLFDPRRVTAAAAYLPPHPKTWEGMLQLLRDFEATMVAAFSLPVLLVSIAGALLVWRTAADRLVLLLPLPALFFLLVLPTRVAVLRYLLPLTLIIDAFAAYAVLALRRSRWRPLWLPLVVLLCGWRLAIAADLTYAQAHDTRYAAGRWLATHVRPGERLEFFGVAETLPPLPAAIGTRRVAGRTQWVGERGHGAKLLAYLASAGPEFLVMVPDWTSGRGMEHSADCPPEVYRAMLDGTLGYIQVAYFAPTSLLPGPLHRPPLDNPSVCPPVRVFARRDVAQRLVGGA